MHADGSRGRPPALHSLAVTTRFAYLHGFASGPLSRKGQYLSRIFSERGLALELPDLNRPSFAQLSHGAALEAIDQLCRGQQPGGGERDQRWCLIGSSFGSWLAARWAELHPDRVERMVLLCPGFGLADRWPLLLGPERMARWEREGSLEMPDGAGVMVPVHWRFYEEAREQPPQPEVPCETLIIHGSRDEIVPIEGSRSYAAAREHVQLLELDDDHALAASAERIAQEVLGFFEL